MLYRFARVCRTTRRDRVSITPSLRALTAVFFGCARQQVRGPKTYVLARRMNNRPRPKNVPRPFRPFEIRTTRPRRVVVGRWRELERRKNDHRSRTLATGRAIPFGYGGAVSRRIPFRH